MSCVLPCVLCPLLCPVSSPVSSLCPVSPLSPALLPAAAALLLSLSQGTGEAGGCRALLPSLAPPPLLCPALGQSRNSVPSWPAQGHPHLPAQGALTMTTDTPGPRCWVLGQLSVVRESPLKRLWTSFEFVCPAQDLVLVAAAGTERGQPSPGAAPSQECTCGDVDR